VRALQSAPAGRVSNVAVKQQRLALLSSLVLGCNGCCREAAVVDCDLQGATCSGRRSQRPAEARRLNDASTQWRAVFLRLSLFRRHAHNRHEGGRLVILRPACRAPRRAAAAWSKIRDPEIARIRKALVAAGLLDQVWKAARSGLTRLDIGRATAVHEPSPAPFAGKQAAVSYVRPEPALAHCSSGRR